MAGPHAVPVHSRPLISACAPPWSMAYSTSRSPAVRTTFGPWAHGVADWLNSKSISVVPDGSRDPGPGEVEEPRIACLGVAVEGEQVRLVVRDRAGDLAGTLVSSLTPPL